MPTYIQLHHSFRFPMRHCKGVKLDLSFNLSRTQKGVCAFCLPWHYTLNPTLFFDCYIRRLQCIEGPVRLVLKTQCPYTTLTKLL